MVRKKSLSEIVRVVSWGLTFLDVCFKCVFFFSLLGSVLLNAAATLEANGP